MKSSEWCSQAIRNKQFGVINTGVLARARRVHCEFQQVADAEMSLHTRTQAVRNVIRLKTVYGMVIGKSS